MIRVVGASCHQIQPNRPAQKIAEYWNGASNEAGAGDALGQAQACIREPWEPETTVRNLRWFQVTETRGHIENGEVAHWQVTIKVGFTLEE